MNTTSVLQRSSMRGLRKCASCGRYNGQRAKSCRNPLCELSIKAKPKPIVRNNPITVQLQTNCDTQLFSVPSREKDPCHRSFVQVTDRTISSDDDGCIISRNAICYVDTCKYDSHDLNISCKHIQWALEGTISAEVTPIQLDVWNRLRKPDDEAVRGRLWDAYQKAISGTPMVQLIYDRMFAVECEIRAACPAGRLHVTLKNEGKTGKQPKENTNESVGFDCACKTLAADGSAVLEKDYCSHIWLVIAAILSTPKWSEIFHNYIQNYLEYKYVEPALIEISQTEIYFDDTGLGNCLLDTDCIDFSKTDFYDYTMGLVEPESAADLINSNNSTMDDPVELIQIPPFLDNPPVSPDPTTNQSFDLENIKIINDSMTDDLQSLELIDCQIELMDEFRLTDHIDLCSNEIEMDENELFGNATVNLPLMDNEIQPEPIKIEVLPPAVMNQSPEKSITESDKFVAALMVPKTHRNPRHDPDVEVSGSMLFDQWLDSVIEQINQRMDFNDCGRPEPLVLSVCHGFFNTLRSRFSAGLKRSRLPLISTVGVGKRQGLCRYTWMFTNLDLIRSIFRTKSYTIEHERLFRKCSNGRYKPLPAQKRSPEQQFGRPIQPTKYCTALKLKPVSTVHSSESSAFTIEWTPNVLPKSRFGEMRIHFQFCHKKNNRVIEDGVVLE